MVFQVSLEGFGQSILEESRIFSTGKVIALLRFKSVVVGNHLQSIGRAQLVPVPVLVASVDKHQSFTDWFGRVPGNFQPVFVQESATHVPGKTVLKVPHQASTINSGKYEMILKRQNLFYFFQADWSFVNGTRMPPRFSKAISAP